MECRKFYLADDLFGLRKSFYLLFLLNSRYDWFLFFGFPWVSMLSYFDFFLRFIPFNRLRLGLFFLDGCSFPHTCFGHLFGVYFLNTSLLRPKDLLSTTPHCCLRDFPRDFILIPGRHIGRGHILDCSFIAIGDGYRRLLLYCHYFR